MSAILKQTALDWIASNERMIIGLSDKVWEYAEVGLQEFKSSKLLADTLEKHGFEVDRGVAGMPTAFIATYGSGKPVIGVLGEYDALPGLSQKAVPYREPLKVGGAGHGCCHNIYGASGVGGVLAAKAAMQAGKITGTVRFFGTPAEEIGVGKTFMVRDGCFNGVDAVMYHHPGPAYHSSLSDSNAMNSVKFIFHGSSSHAGTTPWQGRSSLDAVELMNVGVNFMREHVIPEARIHYVIKEGGGQPNIVPDKASSWYYVRAPQREIVDEIYNWILEIADGAARMTKTRCEVMFQVGVYNKLPNRTLAELFIRNMKEIGVPAYNEDELEFARRIGEQISPEARITWAYAVPGTRDLPANVCLDSRILEPWGEGKFLGGSTDSADVSWNVPTQKFETGCRIIGAPGHHWMNVAVSGMGIGHKNLIFASRVLAASIIDLVTKPEILEDARKELEKRKGGRIYKSPLPRDLKPPFDQFGSSQRT